MSMEMVLVMGLEVGEEGGQYHLMLGESVGLEDCGDGVVGDTTGFKVGDGVMGSSVGINVVVAAVGDGVTTIFVGEDVVAPAVGLIVGDGEGATVVGSSCILVGLGVLTMVGDGVGDEVVCLALGSDVLGVTSEGDLVGMKSTV
mmetsp:Transcript_2103/g.4661  ORF Transcript_2103/g.4661 Transcript_2103/m.4661 type:complete len:144 (+) Transcript_2103:761-1192(+)